MTLLNLSFYCGISSDPEDAPTRDALALRAALALLVDRIGPFMLTDNRKWDGYYHQLQQQASAGLPVTLCQADDLPPAVGTLWVYERGQIELDDDALEDFPRDGDIYLIAYDHLQHVATLTHVRDRSSLETQVRQARLTLQQTIAGAKCLEISR